VIYGTNAEACIQGEPQLQMGWIVLTRMWILFPDVGVPQIADHWIVKVRVGSEKTALVATYRQLRGPE